MSFVHAERALQRAKDQAESGQPVTKRKPHVTPRQKLFAQGLAKGMTQKDAAIRAGYSPATAIAPTESLLNGKALREYFAKLMPKEEKIAATLARGLEATKMQRVVANYKVHEYEDVDFGERRQYARLCANYRGIPETERIQVGPTEELIELKMIEIGG